MENVYTAVLPAELHRLWVSCCTSAFHDFTQNGERSGCVDAVDIFSNIN